jgi:hypothetical protein
VLLVHAEIPESGANDYQLGTSPQEWNCLPM